MTDTSGYKLAGRGEWRLGSEERKSESGFSGRGREQSTWWERIGEERRGHGRKLSELRGRTGRVAMKLDMRVAPTSLIGRVGVATATARLGVATPERGASLAPRKRTRFRVSRVKGGPRGSRRVGQNFRGNL